MGYVLSKPRRALTALAAAAAIAGTGRGQQQSVLSDQERREAMERAVQVKPSDRQVAWQRLEFTGFLHFGVNTFTGREWGEGTEDPGIFNPTDFNADEMARVAADVGMKGLVLVAKHHDGFCLWPSAFTEHSVKNSPWQDGQGDVVREVAEACRKHSLKFGVYLSPADLHEKTYGADSDGYNRYFMNQLRELLTNYGEIFEVWFDGATPKDKGQVYDYQAWYALIRELQPGAVIFGRGPDLRWVGNEAGAGRAHEWSVIPLQRPLEYNTWPDLTEADLGSIEKVAAAKYLHWYPAETDTSIRPGWFWRESENERVRSLDDLLNCYYQSVGNNCVFLLNVPPDSRGRWHENDIARLNELGAVLKATFAHNRAEGAKAGATAEETDGRAGAACDGNLDTAWTTPDWSIEPTLTLELPEVRTFNVIALQEDIRQSQRIERFAVDIWDAQRWAVGGSGWREIAAGTTVGHKKLLRVPAVSTDRVRIRLEESRVRPTLAEVGLYEEPVALPAPLISRDKSGRVSLTSTADTAASIVYTLDGSQPDPIANASATHSYTQPIELPAGGVITARALGKDSALRPGAVARAEFDVCKAAWRIAECSSDQADSGEGKDNAIDEDPATHWHSRWASNVPVHPHWIVIDFGDTLTLKGFTYLPRETGANGTVLGYEVWVSADGKTWGPAPVAQGEFANMKNHPSEQRITFEKPASGRYLKFVARSEVNGRDWASAAEIGVITR